TAGRRRAHPSASATRASKGCSRRAACPAGGSSTSAAPRSPTRSPAESCASAIRSMWSSRGWTRPSGGWISARLGHTRKRMARKKRKAAPGDVATNRQAAFRYHLLEKWECGIELRGSEVKSLREGSVQLKDAYAELRDGE